MRHFSFSPFFFLQHRNALSIVTDTGQSDEYISQDYKTRDKTTSRVGNTRISSSWISRCIALNHAYLNVEFPDMIHCSTMDCPLECRVVHHNTRRRLIHKNTGHKQAVHCVGTWLQMSVCFFSAGCECADPVTGFNDQETSISFSSLPIPRGRAV